MSPEALQDRSGTKKFPRVDAAAWLAAFSGRESTPGLLAGELTLLAAPCDGMPGLTGSSSCQIFFDGMLYNRDELRAHFAADLSGEPTDAELVSQAYCRWGEEAIGRLKGIFSLLIADRARGLLCARDPLGIRPLFYAEVPGALLLSPSIEVLLAHAGVSSQLNRACLVDRLTRRWPAGDETYFTQVRRVPPGHLMWVGGGLGRRVHRYWNPVPADGPVAWIPDHEAQERFEALLGQAVARCLSGGRAGIYLSGGLDSTIVAMLVADRCRGQGWAPPWALSLVFPETGREEAAVQRGVATELGLPHVQFPFEDAVGPEGTLAAALDLTRTMPAPLALIWRPALERLTLRGREHGCRVILAGDGADEWLWENPIIAADLLGRLDLAGLHRLWRIYARSYHFSRRAAFRLVMWRYGVKQLLPDVYHAAAMGLGARRLIEQRWRTAAWRAAASPAWVAPDPTLRAQVAERLEAAYVREAAGRKLGSHYLRDTRLRLDSADKWFREEETFLVGQRMGIPIREPFWDPDLIGLLVRVRPLARSAGGLAKALVRRPLSRRFPRLGFDRQRKSNLGAAFLSVLSTQAGPARQAMGGFPVLADLGVIDGERVRVLLDDALAGRSHRDRLGWAWEFLNLEAWTRAWR
jgi:asparagine synthase (glutamine-hydrolysing)